MAWTEDTSLGRQRRENKACASISLLAATVDPVLLGAISRQLPPKPCSLAIAFSEATLSCDPSVPASPLQASSLLVCDSRVFFLPGHQGDHSEVSQCWEWLTVRFLPGEGGRDL